MTDVTFDALTRTIFIGASPEEGEALKHHISAYLERTSWDIALELVAVPPHVWHPGKPAMRRHARALSETVGGIIARERAKGWPGGGLIARLGTARDPETGQPMPDDVFANNLLTFAAAGHETTAKALSWTLYLLARAPIWQDRVRQEIDRVVGRGDIREDHLDRLPWTRQVLQESMRLYPPAPVIARRVMETTTIAGHTFAPGTMLVVPIFALHRHRQLWRDPDRFDPTRFAPENERAIARTQYMPFGFGPRTCIGMSFAMIEATVLLARFISRARFTCDPGLNPEPVSRVTLRAKGGIALSIEML
jgi:cytochrome P450